jgi:hypothetical protein
MGLQMSTEALMASGISRSSEAPISSSSLEAAENELSRQLDRLDMIRTSFEKTLNRVTRGDNASISPTSGPSDMDSSIGYLVMGAADRVKIACNHLEELMSRVDL